MPAFGLLLLKAAGLTLWISWLALLTGALAGGVVGLAATSRRRVVRWPALVFTETFRSIPILLLMFFCYYGVPLLLGRDLSPFAAATLALALEAASLMATVVRASLGSVPVGQRDAGAALGLRGWQSLVLVVVPQAARVALPPSVGVYVAVLKDSSVASVIGYLELTKTALLIRESSPFGLEALVGMSVLYFLINFAISTAGGALERRLAVGTVRLDIDPLARAG